jgi:hypothetical protein
VFLARASRFPRPRPHRLKILVSAVRFLRRQRALDDPSIDDPISQEEQDKLYWFAPGVGKVREENTMTGSTQVLVTYELGEE